MLSRVGNSAAIAAGVHHGLSLLVVLLGVRSALATASQHVPATHAKPSSSVPISPSSPLGLPPPPPSPSNAIRLSCAVSRHEKRLLALTKALFESKILLSGSVVDSGAHKGGEACFYADLDPARPVHAIEPLLHNVKVMRLKYSDRPNLLPFHGGLGSIDRFVDLAPPPSVFAQRDGKARNSSMLINVFQAASVTNASSNSSTIFHVYRLDDLFTRHWAAERLAFAHFDVEGSELDVLQGANRTLQRDRPVFTVEVGGEREANFNSKLLAMLAALGYRSYVVDEQCGYNWDCRNLMCFPIERLPPTPLLVGTFPLTSSGALDALYNLQPKRGRCGRAPRRLHLSDRSLVRAIMSQCSNPEALKQLVRRLVTKKLSHSYATKHAPELVDDSKNVVDCLKEDSGSVAMNVSETTSWQQTKDACREVCDRCARCRFFSFSRRYRDCSWFAKCNWDKLRPGVFAHSTADERMYTSVFVAHELALDKLQIKPAIIA